MFIELTNYANGQKELVNTKWIEEIRNGLDYRIIYFAFQINNNEQDYLKVKEEYHEIKHLLGVDEISKADTERHAHWIDNGIDYRGANWYKCSNCGRTVCEHYSMVVDEEYPYCHCGCKMDEEKEFNNEC